MYTTASGVGSHAGGYNTNAILDNQTVVGQYNKGSYPDGNDTFVVGAGSDLNHLEDGLKVRPIGGIGNQLGGKVIINNSDSPFGPVQIGNTQPYEQHSRAGLYLGEPQVDGSTRIITIKDTSDNNSPNLYIQGKVVGTTHYQNLIVGNIAAAFVPNP
jgi:hypothetical protein